jgi:hypothetical protein
VEVIPVSDVASARRGSRSSSSRAKTAPPHPSTRRQPRRPGALLPLPEDRRGPTASPEPARARGRPLILHRAADPVRPGRRPRAGQRPEGQLAHPHVRSGDYSTTAVRHVQLHLHLTAQSPPGRVQRQARDAPGHDRTHRPPSSPDHGST